MQHIDNDDIFSELEKVSVTQYDKPPDWHITLPTEEDNILDCLQGIVYSKMLPPVLLTPCMIILWDIYKQALFRCSEDIVTICHHNRHERTNVCKSD